MSRAPRRDPRLAPPTHRALWTYMGAWAASRLAMLGLQQGIGWLVSRTTGEVTLDDSSGPNLGFGQFIVLPAGLVLSGTVWLIAAALREVRARWPALAGAAGALFALLASIELAGTIVFYMLLRPDDLPLLIMSGCIGIGAATFFWCVNWRRRR